jgi:fructokinase
MKRRKFTIVGLGELLWDLLPSGKQLGGAPANFSYHAAALGDHGFVASRVGDDALGREATERLKALGLSTKYVQLDPEHGTGTVDVKLDDSGVPDYTINTGAWDHLDCPEELLDLAERTDAVCFGSLAQRSEASRDAISGFIGSIPADAVCVFDINLRQSYYSAQVLGDSLEVCTIAKMSEEELPRVTGELGMTVEGEKESAKALLDAFYLDLVCVTRGAAGCLLVSDEETVEHPGFEVEVADTVGSGDAFTAALVHHLLRGSSLSRAAGAANRLGAYVAGRVGATPEVDRGILDLVTGEGPC